MKELHTKLRRVVNNMNKEEYDDWDILPAGQDEKPNLWITIPGKMYKFIFRTKPTGKTFSLTTLKGKIRTEQEYHDIKLTTTTLTLTNNVSKNTDTFMLKDC